MENIEIKLIDNKSVSGILEKQFHSMDKTITINCDGKNQRYELSNICCILFNGEIDNKLKQKRPGEIVEDIITINDNVYTVRALRQQSNNNVGFGFYAVPVEQDLGIKLIFFTNKGILKRAQNRKIGNILIEEGTASQSDVNAALENQKVLKESRLGEIISDKHQIPQEMIESAVSNSYPEVKLIGDILISAKLVTREQVKEALEEQRLNKNKHLGEILVGNGIISETNLMMALALKFNIRFVNMRDVSFKPELLNVVSENIIRKYTIFPVNIDGNKIIIATANPADVSIGDTLRFHTNMWVEMVVATLKQIEQCISKYCGDKKYVDFTIDDNDSAPDIDKCAVNFHQEEAYTAPIIRLSNKIVFDGIMSGASDIHLLPQPDGLKVSFRTNGLLRVYQNLDIKLHKSLITRFKIMSLMNIAEHRQPQDGRFQVKHENRKIELRVSCMPGNYGENLVMRILDKGKSNFTLSELGIDSTSVEKIQHIVRSVHGMMLVTGPTGSGKSTTLVSVLRELINEPKHLLSVEDPIEAEVLGVNQIQVNEKIGFSFAKALRNILRHDPDVIMVGEIRDPETARIAVQAALTGHILISSLHTNQAAGAFSRLTDMGIEPYLIAATLRGVMAQQLFPKLCKQCRKANKLDADRLNFLANYGINMQEPVTYTSVGCDECYNTGISGRLMVYEFLEVTKEIQKLATQDVPEEEIQAEACKAGMRPMVNMAIEASQKGIISLDQAMTLLVR